MKCELKMPKNTQFVELNGYAQMEVRDLITDQLFIKWVLKPNLELNLFWSAIQQQHPALASTFAEARDMLASISGMAGINKPVRLDIAG